MAEKTHDNQIPTGETNGEEATNSYNHLPLEEQVNALYRDLEETRRDASQSRDLAQRAQAELVNYRRRTDDDRISLQKYSNSRLITKLLPVVDEMELAISHAGDGEPNDSWLEGVKLIQRKLANLLDSEGVVKVNDVGTTFNPLEHEAVGTEESTEHPPDYILTVVRSGYRLYDRVIQPAQVIVVREPQDAPQPNHSPEVKETEYD